MKYINHNGSVIAADSAVVPYDNKAFRYGYGLFETMLLRDGQIRLGEYHWERLFDGLKTLSITLPTHTAAMWLEEQIIATARKNNMEGLCRVRLQVYAGTGGLYDAATPAGFIIECFPLDDVLQQINENGLVVGIAPNLQKSTDSLANLKSSNALIYAFAAQYGRQQKWNDALICNTYQHIIESTIANIFWVKDDIVYTPSLADGCVAGVMRRHWLTALPLQGVKVHETSLTDIALASADEVFLTNAIKPIRWVGAIGNVIYKNSLSRHIFSLINP